MALLDFHHELFGRVGVYAATVGAADLPSTGGAFNVGDLVINLNPVASNPSMWACTAASPSPTFTAIGSFGGSGAPSGAAGGVLSGTYPNPGLAATIAAATITTLGSTTGTIGTLITATKTPASAGAAGVAGQFAWDASFIYICVATNSWTRVAIAAW